MKAYSSILKTPPKHFTRFNVLWLNTLWNCPNTSSQSLQRKNRFLVCNKKEKTNKQGKSQFIAQFIVNPYVVQIKCSFTAVDTTVLTVSLQGCASSDFELHHIFSLLCRLRAQAYEQQVNGANNQHLSMTFIQPSRFSHQNRKKNK